jgi:hypothetical protein
MIDRIFFASGGGCWPVARYPVGMSDVFTRRGFVRATGVGLAALWVPSLARADEVLVLTPRWEVALPALRITLHLRGPVGVGVELPATALRLRAHRHGPRGAADVELQSEGLAFQRRSRAGFRLGRRVVIPAGGELAYDTFTGEWPAYATGHVPLTLRTQLRDQAGTGPEADRAALAALAGLTGQLTLNVRR